MLVIYKMPKKALIIFSAEMNVKLHDFAMLRYGLITTLQHPKE